MAAPNLKEIEWAISELESGESSFQVYSKLADLYACRNEMLGVSSKQPQMMAYSMEAEPVRERVDRYGDSDFLRVVDGKDLEKVFSILDENMETIRVTNSKMYESVMRRLERI